MQSLHYSTLLERVVLDKKQFSSDLILDRVALGGNSDEQWAATTYV